MGEDHDSDMTQRIEEALSRFAIHGQVRLKGSELILTTPRGVFSIPAGTAPSRWPEWGEAERRTRANDLAKAFVKKRNTDRPPPPSSQSRGLPVGLIATVFACGSLGLVGFLLFAPTASESSERLSNAGEPTIRTRAGALDERTERSQRVCEATKARVARGATVNIADTDGWAVDLVLLTEAQKDLVNLEETLAPFLENYAPGQATRFVWPLEPELAAIPTEDARVTVERIAFDSARGPVQGAALSFHGALIDSYFREEERGRFFHVATALSAAFGATHAGLAARCEHEKTYHLGSWFFGKTEATAAASLLFMLGYRGEPPQIAVPFRRPPGGVDEDGFVFTNIAQATERFDRKTLSAALGSNQGMAMGRSGESVVLTFAFKDGSAAARASRHLIRMGRMGGE